MRLQGRVSLSRQGLRTARIAEELGCHPKTVRKRLHRVNALGMDGLGYRPEARRKPRITKEKRSRIIKKQFLASAPSSLSGGWLWGSKNNFRRLLTSVYTVLSVTILVIRRVI